MRIMRPRFYIGRKVLIIGGYKQKWKPSKHLNEVKK